jgi:hypothetical protein
VFLLLSFIGNSLISTRSSASSLTSEWRAVDARIDARAKSQNDKFSKKDKCPNCGPAGNQEIYVPLIDLPEAQSSEIVFNSRSPRAMTITPTFYKPDGTVVLADPVTVQSAEIRYVDIRQLLPEQYRQERDWGGFSLSYYGFNREMWSQVRFLGVNGGNSVDEFFTVKEESRSDQLEAVWWMPERSEAILALGNITANATSATVDFGDDHARTVHLAPHATKVIHYKRDNDQRLGSAVINVTGVPGSIVPTGLIAGKDAKFNSVIRFYSPKLAKQANLFANGFHVAGNAPHMVLRNTTSSSIAVVPKFVPLSGIAAAPFVSSEVVLGPNQTTEVDLAPLLRAAQNRHSLDVVSVEVTNRAGPGSVIGSLYGINEQTGVNYDVPLRDSGPVRTMTGSYPWKIADDFTTVVYITNISDQQAEFIGEMNYDGGRVVIDPRKLEPGETAVFDMERVRADQIPDNAGKVVPREVSLGQFKWSVHGVTNGKLLLIGRAEMVSRSKNISTSYSCNDPCPPFIQGWLDPFLPGIIFVSHSGNASAWESAYYSNGYVSGPFEAGAGWIPDSSAVSVDPGGGHTTTATGELPLGDVCVTADMGQQESYGWDGRDCYDNYNTYAVGDMTCTQVADVHIKQGSNNITATTQNVIVGQQISLSVEVVGTTAEVSNIQWTVPGTRVANFVGSASSGTVTEVSNLQVSPLTFYWTDGGDNRQVTLGCRIGTTQFDKSATFNVKRPSASVTTETGIPKVSTCNGRLELSFGNAVGFTSCLGGPGIKLTRGSVTMPSGFTGDFQWAQLITGTTRTIVMNDGSLKRLSASGVLDTVYPYPTSILGTNVADDTPALELTNDFTSASIDDNYSMWLMFKPSGVSGTSIWVPLRKVDWSWTATATRSGSTWTKGTSSNSPSPFDADAATHPTWTNNITNFTFQPVP